MDNVADSTARGRSRYVRGSENGAAKLDESKVRSIREKLGRGQSMNSIAREYGVSWTSIQWIKLGKAWGHVSDAQ